MIRERTETPARPLASTQIVDTQNSDLTQATPAAAPHAAGKWSVADIPDQQGRVAVITGSNSGIGYATAQALAAQNAHVILAVRNLEKGHRAQASILDHAPHAHVEVRQLDLADLGSVATFARQLVADFPRLDLLINNAGVMSTPYTRTVDGYELQFATNHLGHFALTAHLLPALLATFQARIVTVSSMVHRGASLDFANLNGRMGYSRWRAYQYSKLANLHFAYALQQRLADAGHTVRSIACHPGYTATNLQVQGLMMDGGSVHKWIVEAMNRLFAQDATMGALPTLYAAVVPGLRGGEYVGPDGLLGMWGHPVVTRSSRQSYDHADAQRLWALSESLTGVEFPLAT
ncbi:MAG: oxidoreductase [Litorilinea sp.]